MSHQPINSFGFFMHAAPLLCATAFLFFLFGIGLAYVHLYEVVLRDECASEMEDN